MKFHPHEYAALEHRCIFELTSANARWALMHRFVSVCPSVTGQKISKSIVPRAFKFGFYSFTGNGARVKGDPSQCQRSLSLKCVGSTCNSPYDVIKRQVGSHQGQVAFFFGNGPLVVVSLGYDTCFSM